MKSLMTVLMLLAAPAAAQQVARIVPADFKIHAEPALGVCVASDHVISARKAGMDVALVLGRDGAAAEQDLNDYRERVHESRRWRDGLDA